MTTAERVWFRVQRPGDVKATFKKRRDMQFGTGRTDDGVMVTLTDKHKMDVAVILWLSVADALSLSDELASLATSPPEPPPDLSKWMTPPAP